MNYFLNKISSIQKIATNAKWKKEKEIIDHPYYSVEFPDARGVTYGETIFGEYGACHRHQNSWGGLENPEIAANYNVYVFPIPKKLIALNDKKLEVFSKYFIAGAYKDDYGEDITFKKITKETSIGEIKLSKIIHKKKTTYLNFAVTPLGNKFVTAAGKILILDKKDIFVLFVGPSKTLSKPDYERFVGSFRPEGFMEREPEYPSGFYYKYLMKQKSFYLQQNHCLEGVWGHSFYKNYEKNKTLFFEAVILEAGFSEEIKNKIYMSLLELVEEAWQEIFNKGAIFKTLSEEEYREKMQSTIYKIQLFLKNIR
jgi:hypothetical protein